nr:cyclophane-forming radical SAM/SPASM peptide maturase GrrM/OscB [Pukyongiella litopenaei]
MQLLVLQPTPFCNINCRYCYLPSRNDRGRMSAETLEAVGARVVSSPLFGDGTTVVWHAGEPLVLSPDWYRDAVRILEISGGRTVARQSFQTNATLINDAWLDHLGSPGVSVGVSLDGPEDLHDLNRRDRRGRGTFRATMSGIGKLNARRIPFHIISVITAASLDRPQEVARALVDAGPTSIGLNLEEIDGTNESSSLLQSESQDRVRRFLDGFLDVLDSEPDAPVLREAEALRNLLGAMKSGKRACSQENVPGAIVSVDMKGEISTYSPELMGVDAPRFNGFKFGNVHDIHDLSDVFLGRAFLACHRQIAVGVSKCARSCAHFPLCGGGSPSNKFGETGRLDCTETAFCRLSVKTVLDHLADRLAGPVSRRVAR